MNIDFVHCDNECDADLISQNTCIHQCLSKHIYTAVLSLPIFEEVCCHADEKYNAFSGVVVHHSSESNERGL